MLADPASGRASIGNSDRSSWLTRPRCSSGTSCRACATAVRPVRRRRRLWPPAARRRTVPSSRRDGAGDRRPLAEPLATAVRSTARAPHPAVRPTRAAATAARRSARPATRARQSASSPPTRTKKRRSTPEVPPGGGRPRFFAVAHVRLTRARRCESAAAPRPRDGGSPATLVAVREPHDVLTISRALDRTHVLERDQRVAMDAHEVRRELEPRAPAATRRSGRCRRGAAPSRTSGRRRNSRCRRPESAAAARPAAHRSARADVRAGRAPRP